MPTLLPTSVSHHFAPRLRALRVLPASAFSTAFLSRIFPFFLRIQEWPVLRRKQWELIHTSMEMTDGSTSLCIFASPQPQCQSFINTTLILTIARVQITNKWNLSEINNLNVEANYRPLVGAMSANVRPALASVGCATFLLPLKHSFLKILEILITSLTRS